MQSIGANRAKGPETRAGRLTCRCLNITVHYKGDTWGGRAVEGEKLFPSRPQHPVRRETLREIDLDVAGVTTVSADRGREGGRRGEAVVYDVRGLAAAVFVGARLFIEGDMKR